MHRPTKPTLMLLLLAMASCSDDQGSANTPVGLAAISTPRTFSVQVVETKVLPGKKSTDPTDGQDKPTDGIDDEDRIGDLGIASLWSEKAYYTKGKYNDNDWKVERGVLKGAAQDLPAFIVHPAAHKATKFAASKHGLFYRFAKAVDHTVYEFNNESFKFLGKVAADDIKPGEFVRLAKLTCNKYKEPRTFVIAPTSLTISTYQDLGPGVSAATLSKTAVGQHVQVVLKVDDAPYDTINTYNAGPAVHANRYGQNRRFFPVFDAGRPGILWQAPASRKLYVSWFSKTFDSVETLELTGMEKTALASATSDGEGTLYYVTVSESSKVAAGTQEVTLHRCGRDGKSHESNPIDASKKGLNIFSFGSAKSMSNDSALRYSKGQLGLMIARKMHKSGDGLNHQGAISVVLDAAKMTVVKNHGQSSGHSFESFLTVAQDGRFLAVDLGDNYPRGVHLHRFDGKSRKSRVVHTFKTKHGTSAKNPAGKTYPAYKELTGSKPYYQWSNDNSTYTEVGAVAETDKAFVVVFACENDQLDNAKATSMHNAPRNLGMVLVRKDFENASKGKGSAVVTDDLVLSKGDSVTGGYYSFSGKWMPQRVNGVKWLTSYDSKEKNASRVKVSARQDGKIALFWEQWAAKSYVESFAMVLDGDGEVAVAPTSLGKKLRLNRRDDPFVHEGNIVHVSGNAKAKTLTLDIFVTP